MKIRINNTLWVGAQILFLVFIAGLSSCRKDYVTGRSSYNFYSLDSDVKLGQQVLDSQMKAFKKGQKYQGQTVQVNVDEEQLTKIRTIVTNVAKVSHLPDLPYEVHLAEIPVVNAWAAPGGKMMVYSGLWDPEKGLVQKGNDDELAAVLAHEIAHSTTRHVTEAVSTHMTIMMAGTVAASAISAAGTSLGSNLFGNFFNYGYNIFAPSYSRKNEYEADRIGLFYMAKAGYDPQAAVRVWEKAAKKRGDRTSIYASHPASGDRATTLKKYLPLAMEIYNNPEKPYPEFGELKKWGKQQKKGQAEAVKTTDP